MQAIAKGKIKSLEEGRELVSISFPQESYLPNENNSKMFDSRSTLIK